MNNLQLLITKSTILLTKTTGQKYILIFSKNISMINPFMESNVKRRLAKWVDEPDQI